MTNRDIIKALNRIAIYGGSYPCWGCGYEHNCGINGCAIMRAAADRIEELSAPQWISVKDRLPELEGVFLVIVDGKPNKNVELIGSVEFAEYWNDEGWFIEAYPEWQSPNITHWMSIPETPRMCNNNV